jgi:hypothetical protein
VVCCSFTWCLIAETDQHEFAQDAQPETPRSIASSDQSETRFVDDANGSPVVRFDNVPAGAFTKGALRRNS